MIKFPDVSKINILVVGDIMLDQYRFGNVARISPEAPVPIVNVTKEENRCGGAANVALNVASMGANSRLISVAGDDEYADILENILVDAGIAVNLTRSANYKTTVKQRIIAQNQQLLRLDFEDRPFDEILARCLTAYKEALDWADVIILSDYGKGGLNHVSEMIALANAKSIPVVIDPKGDDYSKYKGATLITPNLSEFKQVVGSFEEKDLENKALALVEELQLTSLLVTMSEKGMALFNKGNAYFSPAKAQEVFDVSGAGDTVIATMAIMSALEDVDFTTKLMVANAAASVVVAKLGTATTTPEEINLVLEESNA